jgi:PAS domain S-box-containing protein
MKRPGMLDKLSLSDESLSFTRMLRSHKTGFDGRFLSSAPWLNIESVWSFCADGFRAIRTPLARYGLALVFVAAAVALRTWLDRASGKPSDAVFLAAILIAAWVGGVGPALLCTALLHFVHGYWFQIPQGVWGPTLSSIVYTISWYVIAILVGVLSQMKCVAQRHAHVEQPGAFSPRDQIPGTLLSCLADGVLVIDLEGRVTFMNPAAETMTAWKMACAKGKPWREVFDIHHEDREQVVESPVQRVLRKGGAVHERVPLVLTSRSDQTMPIAYSAAPVFDLAGQTTGVVLIFRDESQHRRTELTLRNANQQKDEFLATLAHELRNPLAPISMGLELLKLSANDPPAAEQVRSMMQRQTQHMVRLIDDLLDISRITSGMFELRKNQVEVADIVRDAVEATQPLLEEAKHQLTVRVVDKPLLLYADANRLTQVLINLLNNAAKYTPRQGRIELTAARRDGDVVVTISDSGIGIPADKIDHVFDIFARLNEESECGPTGMGIGLTLVKRLVELHGGSVKVQSHGRNLGTTFSVRLPAFPEPPMVANRASRDVQDSPTMVKRRILVVDDDDDALESLSRLVMLMGHDVRRAHDGLEAFYIARSFQPDIVLMDLEMPRVDGYEAARRIRQEPWGHKLALVATTGWGQEESRRIAAEAGFDCHLVKPIAIDALRRVLGAPTQSRDAQSLQLANAMKA